MTDAPKKRGRPSKGKRGKISFRVTSTLRDKLEAKAAVSGRSISEEVELILEMSFAREEWRLAELLHKLTETGTSADANVILQGGSPTQ